VSAAAWGLAALAACAVPGSTVDAAVPAPALVFPAPGGGVAEGEPPSAEEGVTVRVDESCEGVVLYELAAADAVVRARARSGVAAGLRWPATVDHATLRYGCDSDGDGVVSGAALVTQPVAWRIDRARPLVLSLPRADRLDALVVPPVVTRP
jgi:hypothetical protein